MSLTEVPPNSVVAMFVNPMPLTALDAMRRLVEHVYGTGETKIRFEGNKLLIVAPDEGFGPRPKGKFKPGIHDDDQLAISTQFTDEETLEMVTEATPEILAPLAMSIAKFLDSQDATNFVTMKLTDGDDSDAISFLVGRAGRPNAGELFLDALDRIESLRTLLTSGADIDASLRAQLEAIASPLLSES